MLRRTTWVTQISRVTLFQQTSILRKLKLSFSSPQCMIERFSMRFRFDRSRSRRGVIFAFGGCNWTLTHNHLVCKRTLNQQVSLAKQLNVLLRTKWLQVRVQLQSLKLQISFLPQLLRPRSSLKFWQLQSMNSL